MSQQRRLIQIPLVGTILLCLLVGLYLLAWKRFSKPDPASTIIKHPVEAHPDDVLKYWTVDKKRQARASRLPNVDTLEPRKQHPRHPSEASGPHDA